MQLAPEIGLCLNVGGIGPEGPADALTRNGTGSPVEHEKGEELLLARARKTGKGSAVNPNIEPTEQIDSKRGRAGHISKITRACARGRKVSLFSTSRSDSS